MQLRCDDASGVARAEVGTRDHDSRFRDRADVRRDRARLLAADLGQRKCHRGGGENASDVAFALAVPHQYQLAHVAYYCVSGDLPEAGVATILAAGRFDSFRSMPNDLR